jgi:hypothetical protein
MECKGGAQDLTARSFLAGQEDTETKFELRDGDMETMSLAALGPHAGHWMTLKLNLPWIAIQPVNTPLWSHRGTKGLSLPGRASGSEPVPFGVFLVSICRHPPLSNK